MRDRRLRGSAFHGVVSTGASTPESFGFSNPETTPLSIPTNPATAPPDRQSTTSRIKMSVNRSVECVGPQDQARLRAQARARQAQLSNKLCAVPGLVQ